MSERKTTSDHHIQPFPHEYQSYISVARDGFKQVEWFQYQNKHHCPDINSIECVHFWNLYIGLTIDFDQILIANLGNADKIWDHEPKFGRKATPNKSTLFSYLVLKFVQNWFQIFCLVINDQKCKMFLNT